MPRTVRLSKEATAEVSKISPEVTEVPDEETPEDAPPEEASGDADDPDADADEEASRDISVREAESLVETSEALLEKARGRFMSAYDDWVTKHGDAEQKRKLAEDALAELEESLK